MSSDRTKCPKCGRMHMSKHKECGTCRISYCIKCGQKFSKNDPDWTMCGKHRFNKRQKSSGNYSEYII